MIIKSSEDISLILIKRRNELKLTKELLSNNSNISKPTILNIENNTSNIRLSTLLLLSDSLNLKVELKNINQIT